MRGFTRFHDPKVKETLATFSLSTLPGYQEAQKIHAEQAPLWIQFMAGAGLKPEHDQAACPKLPSMRRVQIF